MPHISRDHVAKADDQQFSEVPVPEWAPYGDPDPESWTLRLRGMTGTERDRFEASMQPRGNSKKPNLENFRARLIIQCAVDENGNRIFNSGDIKMVGGKSAKSLSRIFDKCQEMNGLSESDVEDLTEGFDSDPSEGSTSG